MPFSRRRSSTRGTPRGLLGSSGSITRHSKSVRSYRLMQMLSQGSTQWARPPAYDRACLAVVAITPHSHYDSNYISRERNAMRTSLYDLSVPTAGGPDRDLDLEDALLVASK